ncbi:MAG: ABC transporter ATP-binding protein [Oscillospiraceae bacterium]|nr:ABC transporter ATP-binding protein [Oscillospiraceae bacterium]
MANALLQMINVSKYFGSVAANVDVNLTVEAGETHALLGENGAGKSTLMNILYGLYKPSSGHIYYNGKLLDVKSPQDAIAVGIGMVHQHFMLVPALTVIENVVLGMKENKKMLDLKKAAADFKAMADSYGMPIDPWAKVSDLAVGQQQRVEILKALYRKANLLILDEPTAVLTPQETDSLFVVMRNLVKQGLTIIMIGHKMNEIMAVCDRCTILRQGRVISTIPVPEIKDVSQLAELMVGQHVELSMNKSDKEPGSPVLSIQNISYADHQKVNKLKNISFDVHAGEIVGICGVDGNGQSELVRCVTGLLHPTSGSIKIRDTDVTNMPTGKIMKMRVSHIPEDRHEMGMLMDMNLNDNLILMAFDQPPYSRHGILNCSWIKKHNDEIVKTYNVKSPDVYERAGNLSGGNQQKLVVGREIDRNPDLLIAMHPDRGLDIGATKFIQQRLLDQRERGTAVLLVSTELDEIMDMSDRIVVINGGEVVGIVNQKDATREQLGLMMTGVRSVTSQSDAG